jgi:hypothetical protein
MRFKDIESTPIILSLLFFTAMAVFNNTAGERMSSAMPGAFCPLKVFNKRNMDLLNCFHE